MPYRAFYNGELAIIPALKPEDRDVLDQIIDDNRSPAAQEANQIYAQMNEECGLSNSFSLSLSEDGQFLGCDNEEQREGLEDWLQGLIKHFFRPRGYSLEGEVSYSGDGEDDHGWIYVQKDEVECIEDVIYNDGPSWARAAYMSEPVRSAATGVVDSADDTGCDGDLTVCSKSAVAVLDKMLKLNQLEKKSTAASQYEGKDTGRPDSELSPSELSDKYDKIGEWGEHPEHGAADWRLEVAEGLTRRGYWDWVACKLEEDS
jgi:hypothetical protein